MKGREVKCLQLSHVWLFATPWTGARQDLLSMGFSRQAYWSGLPFPSPGDLPDPRIKPGFPVFQADSLPSEPAGKFNHKENNMQSWLYENWAFAYQKIFRKWKEKVQSEKNNT